MRILLSSNFGPTKLSYFTSTLSLKRQATKFTINRVILRDKFNNTEATTTKWNRIIKGFLVPVIKWYLVILSTLSMDPDDYDSNCKANYSLINVTRIVFQIGIFFLFLPLCVSVFLSVYLSVCPSVCRANCLSLWLSVCLSACLSCQPKFPSVPHL